MIEPTMLYKWPGKHHIHNDKFDYIIVDSCDIDQHLKQGWSLTMDDAKQATPAVADDSKPTRAELEQKAVELGIRIHGKMADKTIAQMIDDRIKNDHKETDN